MFYKLYYKNNIFLFELYNYKKFLPFVKADINLMYMRY